MDAATFLQHFPLEERRDTIASPRFPLGSALRVAKNIFSQNGEDGIIAALLEYLKTKTTLSHSFCEFGASDGINCSNTYALVQQGWSGLAIEANPSRFERLQRNYSSYPSVKCCLGKVGFGTADDESLTLDEWFAKTSIDGNGLDILSIDIDYDDYFVWEKTSCTPKMVIFEVNAYREPLVVELPGGARASNKLEEDILRKTSFPQRAGMGCSFAAAVQLGLAKGYLPVAFTGNVIFVRKDLVDPKDFPFHVTIDGTEPQHFAHLFTSMVLWGPENVWCTNPILQFNVAATNARLKALKDGAGESYQHDYSSLLAQLKRHGANVFRCTPSGFDAQRTLLVVVPLRNRGKNFKRLVHDLNRIVQSAPCWQVVIQVGDFESTDVDWEALRRANANVTINVVSHPPPFRCALGEQAAAEAVVARGGSGGGMWHLDDVFLFGDADTAWPDDLFDRIEKNVLLGETFWAPIYAFERPDGSVKVPADDHGGCGNVAVCVGDFFQSNGWNGPMLMKETWGLQDTHINRVLQEEAQLVRRRTLEPDIVSRFHKREDSVWNSTWNAQYAIE